MRDQLVSERTGVDGVVEQQLDIDEPAPDGVFEKAMKFDQPERSPGAEAANGLVVVLVGEGERKARLRRRCRVRRAS
ncbi:hypothetical protein OMP38_05175 [Cohnella ginsengisoli]|uniref:Uncharacterized protein n=1 Tax=Cohnella ginsengisoli TaxID=425004 RepID=A0A9X4QL44_9BACL|nr:hypothetical protein [Cohnella ginsengisoli]MDG0790309.1 hypothetical protein [Cohnella ginsengisoli]